MPEYGFSMTRILPYKDRIVGSVLIQENTGQRKPVFWHILRSARYTGLILRSARYIGLKEKEILISSFVYSDFKDTLSGLR